MIELLDFIVISITPAMKKRATEMANARRISSNHPNPNDEYVGAVAELALRKFFYDNNREYTFSDVRGTTDNGVDLTIAKGTINVKASEIEPALHLNMIAKEDTNHMSDLFVQCFVVEGQVVIAGAEYHDALIDPENLGELVSSKWGTNYNVYKKQIRYLNIKPAELLQQPFTNIKLPIDN